MQDAFFRSTQLALENITRICDLIHPLTLALWHTCRDVSSTISSNPEVKNEELARQFGYGSDIHGVNYKRVFNDMSWDDHKSNIAWLFLNSLFPIYEGWLEELSCQSFPPSNGNLDSYAMQFPSSRTKGNVFTEINRLTTTESKLAKDAFYSEYSTSKHRCLICLDNLMVCYRYFKEMRNCYMHNGNIANQPLINAYNAFSRITNPSDLCMSEIPVHIPPVLGEPAQLDLRGVIGFSQIILQIMVTIDAELLRSKYAEAEIIRRLSEKIKTPLFINKKKARALKQIQSLFTSADFVSPDLNNHEQIVNFLVSNHFIYPITII